MVGAFGAGEQIQVSRREKTVLSDGTNFLANRLICYIAAPLRKDEILDSP